MVRKTENDGKKLLITNCRLFDAAKDESTTSVLVENGAIRRVGQIAKSDVGGCDILDANGRIIAPGFIDVHIQGAGGADILDGTPEALRTIAQTCAHVGTTSFLATTVFKPGQENKHIAVAAEHVGSDLGGANLLGIHLEGPFISPAKKGMIAAECIAAASLPLLDKIREITGGRLKIMTIAPELPGSIGIIRRLADAGVVVSFGHSNATYEETMKGFDAGISHVTHLFNAMPSIHHRMPGPVAAIFEARHVTAQVITDGVHIHPAVVRLAFKMLGPERIVPITDAMQAMGLGDGKYVYNGIEYECKDGTARYSDGTLIGTALGLNEMVRRLMRFTACPLEVAVKAVTENPARLLGVEGRKGSLTVGKDADMVLLDQDGSVSATIVGGRVVCNG